MGLGLGLGLDKPKGLIYFQNQFSMEFDGASDRIITDDADTVLQNTTYSFWCKSSETGQNRGVFGHGALNQGAFHFNWSSTRPLLYLGTGYYVHWNYTIKQGDGKWHHWVVYSDPNNLYNCKLYCDGVLQTVSIVVATSGASANAYTESLTIGADGQGPSNNHFLGSMDEFAVFDRELTQAEITRMYNTYYTNNLVKNGNFEEIGGDVVQNGSFEQIGGEEVTNGTFNLGNDVVQNGTFSQEGLEELTNGNFEQLGGDLVTNGDFSSGGAGWQSSNTTFANGIATIAYAGSGKLSAVSSLNYTNGETYKVSLTLKGSGGVVNINADASSIATTGGLDHNVTLNGETQNIEVYFQADANANNIVVQGVGAASYTFDVDNIVIKQTGIGWSKGTGWSVANGLATHAGGSSNTYLNQTNSTTVGKIYKAVFTLSGSLNATNYIQVYGVNPYGGFSNQYTSAGTYTLYFTADATFFRFRAVSPDNDVSVDDVSVKEVGQYWQLQYTGTGDWSITDKLNFENVNGGSAQLNVFEVGKTYKITVDYVFTSGTRLILPYDGSNFPTDGVITTTGSVNGYTYYYTPNSTTLLIYSDGNGNGSVDNISVEEVEGWFISTECEVENNQARIYSSDGGFQYIRQSGILDTTKQYKLEFDVISSNGADLGITGAPNVSTSVLGRKTVYFNPTSTYLQINRSSGVTDVVITNISVKEVGQNWDFGTGWSTDGTKAIFDDVNDGTYISQSLTLNSSSSYKFNITISDGSGARIQLTDNTGVGLYDFYSEGNLANGNYEVVFTTSSSASGIRIYGYTLSDSSFSVDNVVIQEAGAHWTFGTGWGMGDGYAVCDGTTENLDQYNTLTIGKTYKAKVTVSNMTTGTLSYRLGGASSNEILSISSNGEYTANGIAGGTGLRLRSQSGFDGSIDNVVVQQLKHQATNLLVNSGDYQSASPLLTSTKSMNFDGIDDFLKVEDSANLRGMAALTVCCWVKFDTKNDYAKVLDYSSTSGNSQRKYRIQLNSDIDQKIQFLIANTSDTASTITSTDAIPTDRWVHLVGTFDNSLSANRQSFYIDGVLQNTATAFTETINNDDSGFLSFGENTYGSNNFDGQITEAGVYDRALTLLEVASLYNQGVPTNLLVNRNNYQSGNPVLFNTKQVDFDGVDDYLVAESPTISTEFTVSAWINTSDSSGEGAGSSFRSFFSTGTYFTGTTWKIGLKPGGEVEIWQASGARGSSTTNVADGNWHFVTYTKNSTEGKIYVDGVLESTSAYTTILTFPYIYIGIGGTNSPTPDNGGHFNGKISQIGLWNEVLTADEVSSLYNHGLPIDLMTDQAAYESSSNLVGYWRMGSGTNDGFPIISDQLSPSLAHISTTNLLDYSEDFSQSYWTKYNGTISPNSTISPESILNADLFTPTANSGIHYISRIVSSSNSNTLSCYVKSNGYNYVVINFGSSNGSAGFDLSNGTITSDRSGVINQSITPIDNGWYRISVSVGISVSNVNISVQDTPFINQSWVTSWTANGTDGIYLWGVQAEQHPVATPYVKSNGIPGQRKSSTTNLFPYSEDFSQWSELNSAVVTTNQITSPIGTLTADKFTFDGTQYGRVEKTTTVTNGNTYTFSVYLKNNNLSDVTQVWIGFSLGAQGQFFTITNEWQRYSITVAANGSSEFPRVQFSGTGSLFAWGAQVEDQTQATPYIKTVGSPVTVEFYKENNYAEMVNLGGGADFSDGIKNGSPYANVVQDSDFGSSTGWSDYGTVSFGTNQVTIGASSNSGIYQSLLTQGKTYIITTDIIANNGVGEFQISKNNGVVIATYTTTGLKTITYTHDIADPIILWRARDNNISTLNSVTVEEVNTGLQGYWKMGDGTNDEYPVIYDQTNPTLSAEKVINGDFSQGLTGWVGNPETTLSVSNGQLDIQSGSGSGQYGAAFSNVNFKSGETYIIRLTVVSCNNTNQIRVGGRTEPTSYNSNIWGSGDIGIGTHAKLWTAPQDYAYLSIGGRNDVTTLVIDNVSVKKVSGNPATMTHMPEGNITNQYPLTKIRNYYRMGDGILDSKFLSYPTNPLTDAPYIFQDQTSPNLAHIPTTNLITYSEDITLSNGYSVNNATISSNQGISPIGDNNATKLTATTNDPFLSNLVYTTNKTFTLSVYAKGVGSSIGKDIQFILVRDSYLEAKFSGEFALTDDWVRYEATITLAGTPSSFVIFRIDAPSVAVAGDEVLVWGCQFEEQNQATAYIKSDGIAAVRKSSTTNLITYSNSNGLNFTFDNVSMTYNSIVSPDGLTNGILFKQTGTSSSNSAYNYNLTTADGKYTYSIFIKAKDSTSVRFYQSGGSATSQDFNPQTMVVGVLSGGLDLNFENVGDGWFRVSFTKTLSSAPYHRLQIYPDRTNNQKGVYIFGLQVEQQTQAETYVPTKGIPVTIDLFKENNYGHTQGGTIQKDVPRNS